MTENPRETWLFNMSKDFGNLEVGKRPITSRIKEIMVQRLVEEGIIQVDE